MEPMIRAKNTGLIRGRHKREEEVDRCGALWVPFWHVGGVLFDFDLVGIYGGFAPPERMQVVFRPSGRYI